MSETRTPYRVRRQPVLRLEDDPAMRLQLLDEAIAIADDKSLAEPTHAHLRVVVAELRRHCKI